MYLSIVSSCAQPHHGRPTIRIIGTNFKQSDLERVARVQWPDKEAADSFLEDMRRRFGIAEIFFLQTCNRREFYFHGSMHLGADFKQRFLAAAATSLNTSLDDEHFYEYHDHEAAMHLFRVASSLDSMVLGETEIMKQLQDQSRAARAQGIMGRRLRALVDSALRTARQVRHRTQITRNVVSMASLAYRRTRDFLAHRANRRVVFVGRGHFVTSIMSTS